MEMIGMAALIGGTALSAYGTIAGGKAERQAADFQAGQLENQAGLTRQRADLIRVQADEARAAGKQELASAQVEAEELKRRKELALSAQQARAAAGGFSATDPTSLALADEVSRYGTLQEKMALFGGKYRRAARYAQARSIETEANIADLDAENIKTQADYARWQGEVAKKASNIKAASTILGGVSNLAMKYNPSGVTSFAGQDDYRYGSSNLVDRNYKWGTTSTYRAYG